MSKEKPKVPETKIKSPTIVKLNKTQRELLATKKEKHNEGIQTIIKKYSELSSEIFDKLFETFAEELGIDTIGENWKFDHNTQQFTKQEKK